MKKTNLLKTLPLVLALASCQSMNQSASTSTETKTVVATYSGGEVTLKEVSYELEKLIAKNDKLKGLTFDKLNTDQKEMLVKEVVLKNISYKEAKKRGLNKDGDYQEALKLFESDMLKQKLLITLVKDAQDEKNVRKNYDELVAKVKDKKDYKLSYIVVKSEKEANEISQILKRSPALFSYQAKKKSLDKEIAKKGGELGFVIEDALPKEVIAEIKNLQKDQISKPVFANDRWIIVRYEDERPAEILPFEKGKDALAQNLAKKAVEDFIGKSLEDAKITMSVK